VLEPERADPIMAEAEQLIRNSVLTALHNETIDGNGHGRLGRVLDGRVKQQLNHELRPRGMMVTRVELPTAA